MIGGLNYLYQDYNSQVAAIGGEVPPSGTTYQVDSERRGTLEASIPC